MSSCRLPAAALAGLLVALAPCALLAADAEPATGLPHGVVRLDETVISGNQELPKVLYILPWRDPDGVPEVDLQTRSSEVAVFRRLYPPAYRRELTYLESLERATSEE
jgi:hypothetical protein